MRLAESAKKFLEFQNMQVFIEQFSLEREGRLSFSLGGKDFSHLYHSSASFTYDVSQTEMSFYEDDLFSTEPDYHTTIEITFNIDFPVLSRHLDIESLVREIEEEYPDIEPILTLRKAFSPLNTITEYELAYTYEIDIEEQLDNEFLDEIFKEHKDVLNYIYNKTIDYLDLSWQAED